MPQLYARYRRRQWARPFGSHCRRRTEIVHDAFRAAGCSGDADPAAVQDQPHSEAGISLVTSASILTGSVLLVRRSRRVSRVTWVSTANPGMPNATPSTTLAVFLPTPGKVTRSSIRGGTSPPNFSTRAALQAMMVFALTWKNPVGLIMASTAWGLACASAVASGYLANNAGVTELTDRSVVCADRMVAISIWNALRCSSSEAAG